MTILRKLKKVVKLLGYKSFYKKSWKEFDEYDYYRIILSIAKEKIKQFE